MEFPIRDKLELSLPTVHKRNGGTTQIVETNNEVSSGRKKHTLVDVATQTDPVRIVENVASNPIVEHMLNIRKVITGQEKDIVVVGHGQIKSAIETAFLLQNNLKTPVHSEVICQNFLLVGLGGVGKTEMLKSLAVKVARLIKKPITVFNVKASDLLSKFVGESVKSIDALFNTVEASAPCIVVFDEVDGLMLKRSSEDNDGTRQFKTGLLTEMRGSRELKNVIIVAATNKPADMDENFSSRFETKFLVKPPTPNERGLIFYKFLIQLHGSIPIKIEPGDYDTLIKHSEGYTGNDIRTVVGKAAAKCLRVKHNGRLFLIDDLDEIRIELESLSNPAEAILQPLTSEILLATMSKVRPSLSSSDVKSLYMWGRKHITSLE